MALKVKPKITLKPGAVKALTQAQIIAIGRTAEQMRTELIVSQVMPFDTGNLQNVATYIDERDVKKGKVKIVHDTPYALRLYYHPEYNFQKTFNINAQGLWWEDWLNGVLKSRPQKLFSVFYKKATGGYVK